MKIKVTGGSAIITADIPVFIGATGEGQFPLPGEPMIDFWFQPKKDTCGYLVFDHKDEECRTCTSTTFIYYSWNAGGKLIIDEGLKLERSTYQNCSFDKFTGLTYTIRQPGTYTYQVQYSTGRSYPDISVKKVAVLDLLRFMEGRITLDQLDKLVTKE